MTRPIMPTSTLPPAPKNPTNPARRPFAAVPVRCKGEHLHSLPIVPRPASQSFCAWIGENPGIDWLSSAFLWRIHLLWNRYSLARNQNPHKIDGPNEDVSCGTVHGKAYARTYRLAGAVRSYRKLIFDRLFLL